MPNSFLKHPLFINNPESLQKFSQDMVYRGNPRYAYLAEDIKITQEIMDFCHKQQMPVTFCGSQTSMTGSSVADEGLALSLTKRNRILDLSFDKSNNAAFVTTEPGVILGDLKRAVWEQGYFYPPDPTSFNEAQIGSTVATNATGEDTFKYGPTRNYVEEIEMICADGSLKTLKRTKPLPITQFKNTAGYYLDGDEIDQVIGSEGTLGLITKLKLRLLPATGKNTFLMVLPFSDFEKTIRAVELILKEKQKPRALELIGPGAGAYFKQHPSCPEELKSENNFLYLKEEYIDEQDQQRIVETWFEILQKTYQEVGDSACFERVFIATTEKQLAAIRECRHFIPLKVNEEYFAYTTQGGGKIGTDWWVPTHHLYEMMIPTYQEAQKLGIPFLVFAHIGNGHPHWNFLTRTAQEKQIAVDFVKRQCQQAVLFGGGVAGEHGIGKIKRYLLNIQHSPKMIQKMIALKQKWDPNWILGRGNIFEYKKSHVSSPMSHVGRK